MRGAVDPQPISNTGLLLVEGPQDRHFFRSLLSHRGYHNLQIEDVGGKDGFASAIRQLPKRTGFGLLAWLGLVQDADSSHGDASAERAFGALTEHLRSANLPVHRAPWDAPRVEDSLKVTVFILPHGRPQGYLESWLLETHLQSTHIACARQFVECLGREAPAKRDKAILAAYFASIDPEKIGIGDAIQVAGTISLNSPVFDRFVELMPPR